LCLVLEQVRGILCPGGLGYSSTAGMPLPLSATQETVAQYHYFIELRESLQGYILTLNSLIYKILSISTSSLCTRPV